MTPYTVLRNRRAASSGLSTGQFAGCSRSGQNDVVPNGAVSDRAALRFLATNFRTIGRGIFDGIIVIFIIFFSIRSIRILYKMRSIVKSAHFKEFNFGMY